MKAKINFVTLNLTKNNLTTLFQINNNDIEVVVSKGVTEQVEGNLKNLNFIINFAKDKGYRDIEIHAVAPTAQQELNGVKLPNFQEQTKMYIEGKYKENSSSAKELIRTINKIAKDGKTVGFEIDLSKEDGINLLNSAKEMKAKSPDEYQQHCYTTDKKTREVKTEAFKNSYIPQQPQKRNAVPHFEKVKQMQKREQERTERWKNEPFALEVYNDKDEKEPILLMGAKEIGNIENASHLADWWEQVEKKNVYRVGDDLKKLKNTHDFTEKSTLTENDYKYLVDKCKREHNIVDVLDVDIDLFVNKTINLKNLSDEQFINFDNKINSSYDAVYDLNSQNDFTVKIIEKGCFDWKTDDKIYQIEEIIQMQKERNLLNKKEEKPAFKPAENIIKPKKKSGFSIQNMQNKFKGFSGKEEVKSLKKEEQKQDVFLFKENDEMIEDNSIQLSMI